MKKWMVGLIVGLGFMGVACAQGSLIPDKDFREIRPAQTTDSGDKVEVIEFFWYGCPHCYDLEPTLKKWLGKLPADVAFKRVPAVFRPNWYAGAHTYYTLEALGELNRLHGMVFDAIHRDRVPFTDERTIGTWMGQHGVDSKKFEDTYKSFAVANKVQRAERIVGAYQINGVPAIVVDGRYVALGANFDAMLMNTDALIERARAERAASKKK